MEIKKYVLPLHPQSRNTAYDLKAQRFFKKVMKKSSSKIWWFEKFVLPLQPLSPLKRKQRSEKKSLKNLSKRFGGLKKRFYLCTTFRYEKAVKLNEVFGPHRIESVLIEIYERRSLKLLSSKVFIHSKE